MLKIVEVKERACYNIYVILWRMGGNFEWEILIKLK